MDERQAMGRRISLLLKEQGMTQAELADRVGATQAAVSRYVRGSRKPHADTLARIASELHTTSEALLGVGDRSKVPFGTLKEQCVLAAVDMTPDERNELILAILQATKER